MSASTSANAPVDALRDHFGDRKPPDISRKLTACVACRKQKIKCHMKESQPPCARCKKRRLPCTVNRSLQMLLEEDTSWRHSMRRKLCSLEQAIGLISDKLSMPELQDLMKEREGHTYPSINKDTSGQEMTLASTSIDHAPQTTWEVVMDPESGPATIPASVVSTVPQTQPPNLLPTGDRSHLDLVTRGVVSLESAQSFFSVYSQRLDHFLYRILIDHNSLSSVRASSPLLTAAVCVVGALHKSSPEFDACYEDFVNLSTALVFKKNTPDEVRALCIGAFWLNDVSWTLVGLAVRIASEIKLHRCISKMPHEKRECYLRTRLWYLVYVCDHHLSIAYGKPPMTHGFEALTPTATFLDSKFATEDDARLVSQVELWSIGTRVLETFGVDTDAPVSDRLVPALRRFGIDLDTWRANWNERFDGSSYFGNDPRKGVGLHFHFAKLYLCSHAFRGLRRTSTRLFDMSPEIEEVASTAVLSAISILRIIVSDSEIQSQLNGLPSYFDTMIAFAVVFLLKIATRGSGNVRIDNNEVLNLVGQLVVVLKSLKPSLHRRHLLFSIATSIEKLLDRCLQPANQETLLRPSTHAHPVSETPERVQDWATSPSEALFINNYDFLGSQNYLNEFDFDLNAFDFDQMQQ